MPTTYNPSPVLDVSFQYPSDGDAADVASIIALLDLADCTKYFADLLDGTSPGVTLSSPTLTGTAQAEVLNASTGLSVDTNKIILVAAGLITDTGVLVEVGGQLLVHDTADFDDDVNMDGSLQIDIDLNVDGTTNLDVVNVDDAATFNAAVTFSGSSAPTFDGCTAAMVAATLTVDVNSEIDLAGDLILGLTGGVVCVPIAGVDADHTYSYSDGREVNVPTLSGTRNYTLSETGWPDGGTMLFTQAADTTSVGGGLVLLRGVDASQIGPSIIKGTQIDWMLVKKVSGRLQPWMWGAS